jgi:molecular chaperone GrpE
MGTEIGKTEEATPILPAHRESAELREQASLLEVDAEEWRARAGRLEADMEEWRDQALRLQAEMDNFRKRQQRIAQDRIEEERRRLLAGFLQVVDDLQRALAAPAADGEGFRRGVELTHRAAMQLLHKEGVEPIEAENQTFDPNRHEAVATIGRNGSDADANTVAQVIEPGYLQGKHLLRPAKVVVAV